MIHVKEAILVEGRYDKNTLRQIVDAPIFETRGFGVMRDRELLGFLRRVARERGLIILTDSDGAGFVIRNFVKGALPRDGVKHAYIPDVAGKEKRKAAPGKEGKLGVEGMRPAVLLEALRRAGATILEDGACGDARGEQITKADLFAVGLSGKPDSAARRADLMRRLALPEHLSTNGLLEALNVMYARQAFLELMENDYERYQRQGPSEGL